MNEGDAVIAWLRERYGEFEEYGEDAPEGQAEIINRFGACTHCGRILYDGGHGKYKIHCEECQEGLEEE